MGVAKIMVSTDGSPLSDKAIDTAVELAQKLGAELVGMTCVVDKIEGVPEHEEPSVREHLAVIERKAKEKHVPCEVEVVHSDAVSKAVLRCARDHDVKFIVMASRGLGTIGSFLLGSETQKVLHQADRPVLIVR